MEFKMDQILEGLESQATFLFFKLKAMEHHLKTWRVEGAETTTY